MTTNTSESFNCLMKRFIEWKERPIDSLCLALYNLSKTFIMEIIRGRYGRGEYTIREEFRKNYNLVEDAPNPTYLENPEMEAQIFARLREAKKNVEAAKVNRQLS